MIAYWHGLMANVALVAITAVGWFYLESAFGAARPVLRQVAIGCLVGFGIVAGMVLPVTLAPGLLFDLRVALIAVVTCLGGWISGPLAAAIALSYRLYLGGVGVWSGCLGIVTAFAFAGLLRASRIGKARPAVLMALLGLGAGISNTIGFLVLPEPAFRMTMQTVGLATFVLTLTGTLFGGLILTHCRRRRSLETTNQIFTALVEALPDGLSVKDRNGRFLAANSAAASLMGTASAEDLIGRTDFDFYPAEVAKGFAEDDRRAWQTDRPATVEQVLCDAAHDRLILSSLKAPLRSLNGETIALITHSRDVTASKALEGRLIEAYQRLDVALANMADGLVMLDPAGRIVMCNQRYRDLFPKTGKLRVVGASIADIIRVSVASGEERLARNGILEELIADNCAMVRSEGSNLIRLGSGRFIESRTRVLDDGNSLTVLSDVTERKAAEDMLAEANQRLEALAVTDGLTGLPNRRSFDELLKNEFERSTRDGTVLSLLMIDVDHFKNYNDLCGHLAGDDCLRSIARRFERSMRQPEYRSARYGGEEFVAVLPSTDEAGARQVAEELRRSIESASLPHPGSPFGIVTVSIGVSSEIASQTVHRAEDVIALADRALYTAKAQGRNRVWCCETIPADQKIRALGGA